MNVKQSANTFLGEMTGQWSVSTLASYSRLLNLFAAEIHNPADLSASALHAWLTSHGWGSSQQWMAYQVIRQFLRWAYGANHPALGLKIKRRPAPPGRVLDLDQVLDLYASHDTSAPIGRRDLAMSGVFMDTGLRVSEMCRLDLRRLDLDRRIFTVRVKGGAYHQRAFSQDTASWLSSWLADRPRFAAAGTTAVFVSLGGNTPGRPLTRHGLQVIVRSWGKRIGLTLSPHDLRRSMASIATKLGAPEDIAMKAGGWTSHDVFRRYTVGVTPSDLERWFPTSAVMR